MKSALYTQYKEVAVKNLKEKRGYKNIMQVPKISKVVLNVGFGRHTKEKSYSEGVVKTLEKITGQKAVLNKAKKSISNFKIRQGQEIGASVTLRGDQMYEFLYKLIHLTLPRVRDFRGLNPKSFDKKGNYTLGFKENLAFPEMGVEASELIHGVELTVATTANNPEEGLALLTEVGFPFKQTTK